MQKIQFLDTTLRDGEQTPGVSFSVEEKIAIAKQLQKWGITVIEAGFPAASPDSLMAVKEISSVLTTTAVTGLARCVKNDIDIAWEALKNAKNPQIHVFLATSPIHMKYKLNKTKEEVLQSIKKHVSYAKERFKIVQFSPEDATRSELDFLLQAVQTAVNAGATYINIPDTVGYTTPQEYGYIFKFLINNINSNEEIIFSSHCHNDLGMAVANSLSAIKSGAKRVEGTVNGIGERAGNASLEEIAVALHTRRDFYNAVSPLNLSETINMSNLVSHFSAISVPPNKAVVGRNAFAHESGIHQDGVLKNPQTYEIITPELVGVKANSLPLGKLSGRHAFTEKLEALEVTYSKDNIDELFKKFKTLADKKKEITDDDIRILVTKTSVEDLKPEGIEVEHINLVTQEEEKRRCTIIMRNIKGDKITVSSCGCGSIDAIFKAIDTNFNQNVLLQHYSVDAVTHGLDSQGYVHVNIKNLNTGTSFNASYADYDVLIASAQAYVNANLLVKKEEERVK